MRESWAQEKDLPRQRLVRDEALMEIAAHAPDTAEALAQLRMTDKAPLAASRGSRS